MQISELKELTESGKTVTELINAIEIKKYLSIVEKNSIATRVIDSCITENENGLSKIDYFYKFFTSQIALLVNYTDLEFEEGSTIIQYDFLTEQGFVDLIMGKIPDSEINFIMELVDSELDQIVKLNNSIEGILSSKLEKLISVIPDEKGMKSVIKEAQKSLNKVKPENLAILKDIVGKQGSIN